MTDTCSKFIKAQLYSVNKNNICSTLYSKISIVCSNIKDALFSAINKDNVDMFNNIYSYYLKKDDTLLKNILDMETLDNFISLFKIKKQNKIINYLIKKSSILKTEMILYYYLHTKNNNIIYEYLEKNNSINLFKGMHGKTFAKIIVKLNRFSLFQHLFHNGFLDIDENTKSEKELINSIYYPLIFTTTDNRFFYFFLDKINALKNNHNTTELINYMYENHHLSLLKKHSPNFDLNRISLSTIKNSIKYKKVDYIDKLDFLLSKKTYHCDNETIFSIFNYALELQGQTLIEHFFTKIFSEENKISILDTLLNLDTSIVLKYYSKEDILFYMKDVIYNNKNNLIPVPTIKYLFTTEDINSLFLIASYSNNINATITFLNSGANPNLEYGFHFKKALYSNNKELIYAFIKNGVKEEYLNKEIRYFLNAYNPSIYKWLLETQNKETLI